MAMALRRTNPKVKSKRRIALTGGLALPAGSSAQELSCLPEVTHCRHRRIFLGPFPQRHEPSADTISAVALPPEQHTW